MLIGIVGLAAAGYIQDCSRYVAGFFGQQPEDGVGYLFGLASALHGDLGFDSLDSVGFASEGVEVGVDEAGADGVDADFLFGYFFRQAQRESVDRAFRCGVVDIFVGRTDAGGTGGNVDDSSALTAVAGGHAADGFSGAEETSENVGREDSMEARGVHVFETRLLFYGAGVIDQSSYRAQLLRGLFEESDHFRFVTDVGLDGSGFAAVVLYCIHYFFCGLVVGSIVDADLESAGGG